MKEYLQLKRWGRRRWKRLRSGIFVELRDVWKSRERKGGKEKRALQILHVWSTARVSLHARKNLIETYQSLVSLIIRQEGGVRRCAGIHLIRVHRALVETARRRHHWNISTGKALLVGTRSCAVTSASILQGLSFHRTLCGFLTTSNASFSAFLHSGGVVAES